MSALVARYRIIICWTALAAIFFAPENALGEAAQPDSQPLTMVARPSLAPDRSAVVFAFQTNRNHWRLGIVKLAAKTQPMLIIPLPAFEWLDPAISPDGNVLTAVSFCAGDACPTEALHHNIWKFSLQRPDPGQQITRPDPAIRRRSPIFSTDGQEIAWVTETIAPPANRRTTVKQIVVHRQGAEHILETYQSIASDLRASPVMFVDISFAGVFARDHFQFVGRTLEGVLATADGGQLRPKPAAWVLFALDGTKLHADRVLEASALAIPRTGTGYIYLRPVDSANPFNPTRFEIREVKGNEDRLRLTFSGRYVRDISVSDNFELISFAAERGSSGVHSIWTHRSGDPAAVDLDIPERVRASAR